MHYQIRFQNLNLSSGRTLIESTDFIQSYEEVESDSHPNTRRIMLQTNLVEVPHLPVVRTYDSEPTEPSDKINDHCSASRIQTPKINNMATSQLDT